MKIADLYDCFERHLLNLSIQAETDENFVVAVVENYLVNLGGLGFHFTLHAEDTYQELSDGVTEMLRKKIYGHMNVDQFRAHMRNGAEV